jgi:tetratricopeptide (TPR) repeat protein
MSELAELLDLDVSDSMKRNVEAINTALGTINTSQQNEAMEKLNQIHSKVLEVEEYFWRPVDSEDVYKRLTELAKQLGDSEKESHYQYQIRLKKANDLEFLGRVQDFYGNKVKAIEYYDQALEMIPTHELAAPARRKAQKNVDRANVDVSKIALKLDTTPDNSKLWFKIAMAHLNLGVVDKAIEYFDKVMELDPTDPDAHARRGTAMESLGDYKGAIQYLERALELKPTSMIAKRGMNYADYFLEQ